MNILTIKSNELVPTIIEKYSLPKIHKNFKNMIGTVSHDAAQYSILKALFIHI